MADGASSAPAPAPAPVAARGRPTAAPGPIELADEKTVQTLATPDSFGAPLARLSPSPTGHGYGTTPPSASTARRGAKPCIFSALAGRRETRPSAPRTRRPATRRRAAAAAAPSTGGREAAPPPPGINHVLTTTYAPAKFRLERRKRARHKYMAPTTRTHPASSKRRNSRAPPKRAGSRLGSPWSLPGPPKYSD